MSGITQAEARAALAPLVGEPHVLWRDEDMAPMSTDWRRRYYGRPLAVVRPGSTAEVAAVVRWAAKHGVPIVPQGGNTGLSGGATPGPTGDDVVLLTTRLNRIRAVDTANDTAIVEAGVLLQTLQEAAQAQNRLFPLSLAAEGSCTLGGNLATNAGGTAVLRYGNMRDLTLGLEVVTSDGQVWDGLRTLRKDNTGYALREVFIGSEGTLGIITAAALKLFALPRSQVTALFACPSLEAAITLLKRSRAELDAALTAFEVISAPCVALLRRRRTQLPWPFAQASPVTVLVETSDTLPHSQAQQRLFDLFEAALGQEVVTDGVVADSVARSAALWRLREELSEVQAEEGAHVKHDIALPLATMTVFVNEAEHAIAQANPGARAAWFGHLGDGNLHFNVLAPEGRDPATFVATGQAAINRLVHDLVHAHGGSISAEHGLGQLRRDENARYKSAVEVELMRRLKAALDPQGLFNPGKLLVPK